MGGGDTGRQGEIHIERGGERGRERERERERERDREREREREMKRGEHGQWQS